MKGQDRLFTKHKGDLLGAQHPAIISRGNGGRRGINHSGIPCILLTQHMQCAMSVIVNMCEQIFITMCHHHGGKENDKEACHKQLHVCCFFRMFTTYWFTCSLLCHIVLRCQFSICSGKSYSIVPPNQKRKLFSS